MTTILSRRSLLCVTAASGATLLSGRARAEAIAGRAIYPVAIPVYQAQFVAAGKGFFTDAGLDVKMTQGGNGVKMREIVASGQGDIGIGDITHPMQLTNRGRPARVLMSVDTRNINCVFMIRKDLFEQGITSIEALAAWKRPDGKRPIFGVSSIGGTAHLWASYYTSLFKVEQAFSWIGAGDVETMLGVLKTKQVDVLASSPSLLKDSEERGWSKLIFNGSTEANWNKYIGGKVPVTAHFCLAATAQKDPARIQAYTTGLWRATQWIKAHSAEEIYGVIEPFVGSTSHDANVYEISLMKEITDYEGSIDPASFARGEKVWFSELTGIKPQKYEDVAAPEFLAAAKQKYPAG